MAETAMECPESLETQEVGHHELHDEDLDEERAMADEEALAAAEVLVRIANSNPWESRLLSTRLASLPPGYDPMARVWLQRQPSVASLDEEPESMIELWAETVPESADHDQAMAPSPPRAIRLGEQCTPPGYAAVWHSSPRTLRCACGRDF